MTSKAHCRINKENSTNNLSEDTIGRPEQGSVRGGEKSRPPPRSANKIRNRESARASENQERKKRRKQEEVGKRGGKRRGGERIVTLSEINAHVTHRAGVCTYVRGGRW